jgi:glutamate 5-kinase
MLFPMSELDLNNIVVVKVGSSTLAHETDIDLTAMQSIVRDISALVRQKIASVVLVSSGSALIGKYRLGGLKGVRTGEATVNQIASTVGQADLIHAYQDLFNAKGVDIAQGLIPRRAFAIREHYNAMRDALLTLLQLQRIPILNNNDLLTSQGVEWSDNDHLAAYVSAMLNAQRLIILSDVEGLLDSPPRVGGKVIPRVTDAEDAKKYLFGRRKDQSAGGMPSKIETAILMSEFGIPMHLVNGKKPGVIKRVMSGEPEGTLFMPEEESSQEFSQIQRWLRLGPVEQGKGSIVLSTVIADLLRHGRGSSILSIGIEKIERPFEKGEIVDVYDDTGNLLGRGIAQISSRNFQAGDERQMEGEKQSPIVIHGRKFVPLLSSANRE